MKAPRFFTTPPVSLCKISIYQTTSLKSRKFFIRFGYLIDKKALCAFGVNYLKKPDFTGINGIFYRYIAKPTIAQMVILAQII